MNKESSNTVFLNGKNKLIKMFQLLSEKEKNSLLSKVGQRNPKLAEELRFKSITFEKIFSISEKELKIAKYSHKPDWNKLSEFLFKENIRYDISLLRNAIEPSVEFVEE